jgi:hypothetical protein
MSVQCQRLALRRAVRRLATFMAGLTRFCAG